MRAITFHEEGDLSLWDTHSGKLIVKHELNLKTGQIGSACLAPDGTRILTTLKDAPYSTSKVDTHSAQLWDARTGRSLGVLQGHLDTLTASAFSPDNKLIVTASVDNTAGIWDAETGKRIFILEGHSTPIEDASFSPDSTRVLTKGSDQTARVWDVRTGYLLATLQGHAEALTSVEFSHDGNYVLTASKDGTAKIYDVRQPVLAEEYFDAACGLLRYQPEFEQVRKYCEPLSKTVQPKKKTPAGF